MFGIYKMIIFTHATYLFFILLLLLRLMLLLLHFLPVYPYISLAENLIPPTPPTLATDSRESAIHLRRSAPSSPHLATSAGMWCL